MWMNSFILFDTKHPNLYQNKKMFINWRSSTINKLNKKIKILTFNIIQSAKRVFVIIMEVNQLNLLI